MKRHIIWLVVGLIVLVMALLGLKSLDDKIKMPLSNNSNDNTVIVIDNSTEEAAAVDKLILAIDEPITLDSELAIQLARDEYEALSDEAKAKVENLDLLLAAERELTNLKMVVDGDNENEEKPDLVSTELKIGDIVTFTGGDVYSASQSEDPANTISNPSVGKVTHIAEGALHPYHVISEDGGGVYGWVDASSVEIK